MEDIVKSKYIDHTLLKADATVPDIIKLCAEAREHNFMSVCVNPVHVKTAHDLLKGSGVKVCTVIGFPLGQNTPQCKQFETMDAIRNGADEIDMVINVGKLKRGHNDEVIGEISMVREACRGKILKVIIETCLLTDKEKKAACECVVAAGADFVKTSTGFSTGGATVEDVKLLKKAVKGKALVKASGGIRTKQDFEAMIKAGADRIGTSNGCNLIK